MCVGVKLEGRGAFKRKGRKGKKTEHASGVVIDRWGRRHFTGGAWHEARAAAQQQTSASSSVAAVETRGRDAMGHIMAQKAAQADEIARSKARDDRRQRQHREELEGQVKELRVALEKNESKTASLHGYVNRLRERESEAQDSKKIMELELAKQGREIEMLRLSLVEAQAARDARQDQLGELESAMQQHAAIEKAKAKELGQEVDERKKQAARLRSRCAELAGRIGGMRACPHKRSAADIVAMSTDDAAARNRKRVAKHNLVCEIAADLKNANQGESKLLATALAKSELLKPVLKSTREGGDILFGHAKELAKELANVWDEELSMECKVDLGLTDWQLNELRFKFCYEWDGERWRKRTWFKHPTTGEAFYFPEPLVSKHRWRPLFLDICEKHRIELFQGGNVAQRDFKHGLALLLSRCDTLLPPADECTPEKPIVISLGWDALRHAGRHITHGGMKLATFGAHAVSTQSELNFVSTNIFRDNDDHAGLVRGLREWVPALNEAKRSKTFTRESFPDAPSAGVLPLGDGKNAERMRDSNEEKAVCASLPRAHYDVDFAVTLDLSALRSIANRCKGCASHCECDSGEKDERCAALHSWPKVKGTESWAVLKRMLEGRCKLLTKERRKRISHFVDSGHDWQRHPHATCDTCDWRVTKVQFQKELAEYKALVSQAKTNKAAKKKLDVLRRDHRLRHLKAEYMHEELLGEFDAIDFITDLMHGMPLNIAKILFKYSFLDVMIEPEQREELAEYLLSIDCPFDCRIESQSGWMRASAMQAFECGSSKRSKCVWVFS